MYRILLLALACVSFLTSATFAAETAADLPTANMTAGPVAAPSEAELQAARAEGLQRAELAARMNAVIEASSKTLAGLQAMIVAARDAATIHELEGRMAQVKRGTTVDLLRVQAKFARENGRIEQAVAIEAEIDAMLNPKRSVPAMSRRPAPVATPEGGAR